MVEGALFALETAKGALQDPNWPPPHLLPQRRQILVHGRLPTTRGSLFLWLALSPQGLHPPRGPPYLLFPSRTSPLVPQTLLQPRQPHLLPALSRAPGQGPRKEPVGCSKGGAFSEWMPAHPWSHPHSCRRPAALCGPSHGGPNPARGHHLPQKPLRRALQGGLALHLQHPWAPCGCSAQGLLTWLSARTLWVPSPMDHLRQSHDPLLSTASFIFSKGTKKLQAGASVSPETQADLQRNLVAELRSISQWPPQAPKKPPKAPPPKGSQAFWGSAPFPPPQLSSG